MKAWITAPPAAMMRISEVQMILQNLHILPWKKWRILQQFPIQMELIKSAFITRSELGMDPTFDLTSTGFFPLTFICTISDI